ncbi:ATP-binding protein [Candidatus Micrarchaeota archaeon]|nr:ATP-binding protein [Candidatus Micrarchaeota archaeon]
MKKNIMNKFIHFVNRKRELEFLENQFGKKSFFAVLYGRRRVGKSEMIKQFFKGKKALYLLATQEVEKEIVNSFSMELARHFGDSTLEISPLGSFSQLLEYLGKKQLEGTIVAIDEFPYLVDANKSVPSILQKHWDMTLKEKGLSIILCGSSIGAMETEVLGRKSPLYGRRTGQWKLEPLGFFEFVKFFPKMQFERLVELYSISGGIPLYILELDANKSAYENAVGTIAARGCMLYAEAEILLKEELREPKTYFSLMKEIAAGRTTPNELSTAIGVERTSLVRYLDTLIELDLVRTICPINAKERGKITRYELKDNYFLFWFNFVYPLRQELDSFEFGGFKKNFDVKFNPYVGKRFETVCRELISMKNPIGNAKIGTWWGAYREDGKRKAMEIDVVGVNEEKKEALFGECKWSQEVDAQELLGKLKEKCAKIEWSKGYKCKYALFAKSFRKKDALGVDTVLFEIKDLEKMVFGTTGAHGA